MFATITSVGYNKHHYVINDNAFYCNRPSIVGAYVFIFPKHSPTNYNKKSNVIQIIYKVHFKLNIHIGRLPNS